MERIGLLTDSQRIRYIEEETESETSEFTIEIDESMWDGGPSRKVCTAHLFMILLLFTFIMLMQS